MRVRAALACPRQGCPHVQPCPSHARPAWDHAGKTRQERGYGRLAQPVGCSRGKGVHETWDGLRACVLERDRRRCAYCPAGASTVDHRTAKSQGGTDEEANLVAACWPCHRTKSATEGNRARQREGRG